MIKVRFRTNIDCAHRLEWPQYLPDRPLVGDKIRSLSSTRDKHIEMVVGECTWVPDQDFFGDRPVTKDFILEVYLDVIRSRYPKLADFEDFITGRKRYDVED